MMTSDTLPHLGILYEEALGPSILAESPHPHPTENISHLMFRGPHARGPSIKAGETSSSLLCPLLYARRGHTASLAACEGLVGA